jgi:hypothetical protein
MLALGYVNRLLGNARILRHLAASRRHTLGISENWSIIRRRHATGTIRISTRPRRILTYGSGMLF